jgi:hypothetical protein
MASFPTSDYTPRDIENEPGVTFDANNKRSFFAEDLNQANDEIKEIEARLKPLTTTPLPFGFRVGDTDVNIEFQRFEHDTGSISLLKGVTTIEDAPNALGVRGFLATVTGDNNFCGVAFYDQNTPLTRLLLWTAEYDFFMLSANLIIQSTGTDASLNLSTNDANDDFLFAGQIVCDSANSRLKSSTDFYVEGDLSVLNHIDTSKTVKADLGFKVGTAVGVTQNVESVVNLRINAGNIEKKTRTLSYVGGILTAVSNISDWIIVGAN